MGRHSKSGAYDYPREHDRRGSQNQKYAPDRGDVLDPRDTRSSREPPLSREPREVRYHPRERRNRPDSRDPEERAEISVARGSRGLRSSREPRHRTEPEDVDDEMEIDSIQPRDRSYPQRTKDPREIAAAAADPRYLPQDRRDIDQTRYGQDTRRRRDDMDDARLLDRGRDDRDVRQLQGGRAYERDDPSSMRNEVIGQGALRFDHQRDSTSSMPPHLTAAFLPAEGISPEVMQAELSSYLGPEATCHLTTNREARPAPTYEICGHKLTEA
jgi:hypothetical protein